MRNRWVRAKGRDARLQLTCGVGADCDPTHVRIANGRSIPLLFVELARVGTARLRRALASDGSAEEWSGRLRWRWPATPERIRPSHPRALGRIGGLIVAAIQHCLNLAVQRWDISLQDTPDDIEIDAEIVVDQSITHARHGAPFHGRITVPNVLRNSLGSFANNLEASNHGPLHHRIGVELLPRQPFTKVQEKLSFFEDVSENLTRLEGHPSRRQGCGRAETAKVLLE